MSSNCVRPARPRIDQPGIAWRTHERRLELREIPDDGRHHPGLYLLRDAVLIDVVPSALAVRPAASVPSATARWMRIESRPWWMWSDSSAMSRSVA
jgi:hypothetical protein